MAGLTKRISAAAIGFSLVVVPLVAPAQDVPSYATPDRETIHGKVATLAGRYSLTIDDDRGFTDSVTLHDGTVIEPEGVSLEVGQDVTIIGHTNGKTFDTSEIDTDGADQSEVPTDGPGGGYYSGAYSEGAYPPYVIPIGGDSYYYGNAAGGYYYNAGGGNYHPHGGGSGAGSGSTGTPHPRPHGYPVVYPIVRGSGAAGAITPRSGYSAPAAPRTYSQGFSSAPHAAPAAAPAGHR